MRETDVVALAERYLDAKARKDYDEADRLKQHLHQAGWRVRIGTRGDARVEKVPIGKRIRVEA